MVIGSVIKEILRRKKIKSMASAYGFSELPDAEQVEGGQILCFTSGSRGEALKELIFMQALPLKDYASGIEVIDLREDIVSQLVKILGKPVWFAMSHFGCGQDIRVFRDGRVCNLWEYCGIPFLRIYGDYPAYFPQSHTSNYLNSINNYFDWTQVEFYKRWFPRAVPCTVLPPIVYDAIPPDEIDYSAKLNGKVIFPKNGNSPDKLVDYWRFSLPSGLSHCLESIAEECAAKDQINQLPKFDERILHYFSDRGIDLTNDPVVLCFLAAQLDDCLRRIKSSMITRAILDLPVIIRGNAWEHVSFSGKRAIYDPDADYSRTAPLIDQAPAVIDMSPNTIHTPHDRIARAAGRGTAFLTNRQGFLEKISERPEEFSFEFEPESIRECVEKFVENPKRAIELGIEQSKAFRMHYTENNYVETLRSAIQICAIKFRGRPSGTQDFVDFPSRMQ